MTSTNEQFLLPLEGQQLKFVPNMGIPYDPSNPEATSSKRVEDTDDLGEANVMSSQVAGSKKHKVVLDIDHVVKVLPSSTEGHHHLFIDKEITWKQYLRIIKAFVNAGIVEPGYLGASRDRRFTAVRLPWVKKVVDSPQVDVLHY